MKKKDKLKALRSKLTKLERSKNLVTRSPSERVMIQREIVKLKEYIDMAISQEVNSKKRKSKGREEGIPISSFTWHKK